MNSTDRELSQADLMAASQVCPDIIFGKDRADFRVTPKSGRREVGVVDRHDAARADGRDRAAARGLEFPVAP
jgi:hypothetical protein